MSAKKDTKLGAVLPFAFLLAAGGAWWFGVAPGDEELARVKGETRAAAVECAQMQGGLNERPAVEATIAAYGTNRLAYADSHIEPLLGSVAMRAKTLLEPIATACEIDYVRYEDLRSVALPPMETVSSKPLVRARVKVSAEASYMKLVSFLCQAERRLPGMAVAAVRIEAGGSDVEVQRGEFVFEWLTDAAAQSAEGRGQ